MGWTVAEYGARGVSDRRPVADVDGAGLSACSTCSGLALGAVALGYAGLTATGSAA